MCPGFREAGQWGGDSADAVDRESIIVRTVEALVRRKVSIVGEELEIEGEEYSIPWPTVQDDIVIRRPTSFILRRAPVGEFTALKVVTERSAVDGSVTASTEFPRNGYHVELSTGIVRELDWVLTPLWPYPGLPPGTMNLLADYSVVVPSSGDAALMRMVCFMAAARIFNQFKNNRWDVASVSFDGSSTSYLDVCLTKQEEGMLAPLKRGVFPSFR